MNNRKPLDPISAELLERMVDSFDLAGVIDALADICEAKAEHVATAWQDTRTAKLWEVYAGALRVTLKILER